MYDNYYDIKQFSRPYYDDHPQMSISDRAAQFSTFAALTGYDAALMKPQDTPKSGRS